MEERDIHWTIPLEQLVASEGEKCRGLAWINQKAETYYSHRANAIAIPVIILSTLAGTASVGSSSLFGNETQISSVVIGLVSIGVGILNTISSYFSWSRKAEAHRIAYLQYSKLFSIIRVEMSLPREERQEPEQLLKQIRDGMERLAETTPSAPETILEMFNKHFKDEDKSISRPTETNGLQKINIYRVPSIEVKNIDVIVEDARENIGETRTSQEGRSNPLNTLTLRSTDNVGSLGTRGTSSENQSNLPRQEIGTTEI